MKYYHLIFCILCCCLCATLTAQTSVIDSLEQVWASGRGTYSEKSEVLADLSHAYLLVDSAKSRAYAVELLKLAQKSDSKLAEARAYNLLGNYYCSYIFPYQAHAYYIKAEKLFIELEEIERLYIVYDNLTQMFSIMGEDDNTTYYANKILTIAAERKDWTMRALHAQYYLGDARYRNNKEQEALDFYLSLHHRALHMEDSLGIGTGLSDAIASHCFGIYLKMNRFQDALPLMYQLRVNVQRENRLPMLGVAYFNLAEAHLLMHNVDSAEYYINKVMDTHQIMSYLYPVYIFKSRVDSLKGNYLSALANFQKFHHISDSLSKETKTTEMARIKLWHEFDQKELEKTLLQQEYHKQRKTTLTLAIALVMILTLLFLALFFYRKITEKNRQMKELHTVKDKLFSVVAHDLRSPMGALLSVLKLANRNMLDPDTQAQLLKDISGRVDDTYGLIDNLLHWAKSQMQGFVPAPVYFDVQEASRAITDTLQNITVAKQVTLNNHIGNQEVYADRDMFAVVVRNLTVNAIKYTSTGGEVTLSSELSDNMLIISVKDTGTGMSQEVQDKLFKLSETKTQRGTSNESGTGLGLVLCADFVKANGGSIWFASVQGEGSTFYFSLPAKENLKITNRSTI